VLLHIHEYMNAPLFISIQFMARSICGNDCIEMHACAYPAFAQGKGYNLGSSILHMGMSYFIFNGLIWYIYDYTLQAR
jgi:methionyl-tRNA synthetase